MKKLLILLLSSILFMSYTYGQEFNCDVTINTPKLQTADPKIFKSLKTAIIEFMNTRKWTEEDYEPEEKIDLSIVININQELSATSFEAQITLFASRPVYNSAYNSVTFRHLDKQFFFDYGEFEVLDFTENAFSSNLTSTLAFYAYIVLGMDYDSFEELGGEVYLNKAQEILNTVPRGAGKGWAVNDGDRTRYWLIENLLNVRVRPLRQAMYKYHLLGLDALTNEEQTNQGIQNISQALQAVQKVNQDYPGSMIVQTFVNAKRDEIIKVFSVSDVRTRRRIHDIMIKLDATHATDYKALLN
ncbi:MAG: DUF4835 family protein [Saprospiraceae bacterium]|nr:DUF4835 family protein [Saprospiraceae bacterium]